MQIEEGKWKPIHLSRSGPNLSHLFFADDLVIFCKAGMEQAHLLSGMLNHFCDLFGQSINTKKSIVYFSKGTDDRLSNQISQVFGFQSV